MRQSGILMPISSLDNTYGIGSFGNSAYNFIDFLKKAGQHFWQILPIGPTSYGDSPYQTFSTFAGNPYFIDLDILIKKGLLNKKDSPHENNQKINYEKLYNTRFIILKQAYVKFVLNLPQNYDQFVNSNEWLFNYALFMHFKEKHNGKCWLEWEKEYKYYNLDFLKQYYTQNKDEVDFWYFIQYEFYDQWQKLKNYAMTNGIEIIGDMPIYVAMDSVEVWSETKYWELTPDLTPINVAGCPPDYFSPLGQVWGNPLYNYSLMKKNKYEWWIKRVKKSLELYDYVRIDHFRGFEAYYAIPYGEKNAINGKWRKGPGICLFNQIRKKLGKVKLIAEDLGFLTDGVKKLLKKSGFPGMKVLQFAFDPDANSDYLPHNHIQNCVVYPGTHDNPTIKSWYKTLSERERNFVHQYLDFKDDTEIGERMIKCALASVADLAIIPMADYLELGDEGRINTPSTLGNNWTWRIKKNCLTDELANKIASWCNQYRRLP